MVGHVEPIRPTARALSPPIQASHGLPCQYVYRAHALPTEPRRPAKHKTKLEPVSDIAARGGKLSALASRGAPNISAKARQGDTASEYKEGQRKKRSRKEAKRKKK